MRSALPAIFIACIFAGLVAQALGQQSAGEPPPEAPTVDIPAPIRFNEGHGREKMIVIDAATRQKEKERAQKQHDTTFDSSIMDLGLNGVAAVRSNQRPEESPAAKVAASATPKAQAEATSTLTPIPKMELSPTSALSLEVVPVRKSSETAAATATPTPSASAGPGK
jgi:hypothetical protein